MTQFDQVSVVKQANIYFDGKCVSHTVLFADGSKKTIGVIFPSKLVFNTGLPEIMEVNSGVCKVKLAGESEWKTYQAGEQFSVPGNSSFDIETVETLDYVCNFVTAV
ncbi:pyrimidine/purine nucleoside phosphorylase [Sulfuriferula thiophila]|uniref:pyrimidine/purine nucleoside phosphorylase n=1 Tax=Sulfuriferula thiophila TaxID=1781211 RepID=UPI000F606EEF|nr:pyrimidine/purine nucleoside phosphorylase [Sulfuriferula thiophila]